MQKSCRLSAAKRIKFYAVEPNVFKPIDLQPNNRAAANKGYCRFPTQKIPVGHKPGRDF